MRTSWDISTIHTSITHAAIAPSCWMPAAARIATATRALGAASIAIKTRERRVGLTFSDSIAKLIDAYIREEWYKGDRRNRDLPNLRSTRITVDQGHTSSEEMRRSPFCSDFLCGCRWFAIMALGIPDAFEVMETGAFLINQYGCLLGRGKLIRINSLKLEPVKWHMEALSAHLGRHRIRASLAVAFALMVAWSIAGAAFTSPLVVRYRLTLQVKVDGLVRLGSGVIETRWFDQSQLKYLANGRPWAVEVRGEAVTADLGSRGILFALLTGPKTAKAGDRAGGFYYPDEPISVLLKQFVGRDVTTVTSQDINALSHRRDIASLPISELPILVRFLSLADPLTVQPVDPYDLVSSFGPGVELIGATIAVTDDPVTDGIEKMLPWLKRLGGGYLTGKQFSGPGLAGALHEGEFKTGG